MATEKRYVPTADEKQMLLQQHVDCYICTTTLQGYGQDEIQYDHIYNYADGYPQDISNFAPVHASKDERKSNCHKSKGQKSPVQFKEELRVINKLNEVKGLGDLCPTAVKS